MWHSDRPQAQQKLATSLAQLVFEFTDNLFVPFVEAFWATIAANFHLIDSLRMDKFFLLMREYVHAAFLYLHHRGWPQQLTSKYLDVIKDLLLESRGKVADGLRYHIIDVWVDELDSVDGDKTAPLERILEAIEVVRENGRTKFLKAKAREVFEDERLSKWTVDEGLEAANKSMR